MGYMVYVKIKPIGSKRWGSWHPYRKTPFSSLSEAKRATSWFRGARGFKTKIVAGPRTKRAKRKHSKDPLEKLLREAI